MENKSVDLSQKKGRLVVRLMSIAMVAIVIVAVLLTIIGAMSYSRMSMTMVEEELKVATKLIADEFEHEWDGDWALDAEGNLTKGGQNIYEEYTSQMDDLSESTGIEYTLFFGDTRMLTTLYDADSGERMVGTQASDSVVQTVINGGQEYFAENITIGSEKYYGYYVPMKNSDGSIVGMTFSGRVSADVTSGKRTQLLMMILIAAICIAAVLVIGVKLVLSTKKSMLNIVDALSRMAEGDISPVITDEVVKRDDELGLIALCARSLGERLRTVIHASRNLAGNVTKSGDELAESASQASMASNQVSSAVDDISRGAVSQADSVQDSVTNTEDMGTSIDSISGDVTELTNYSKQMQEACDNAMTTLAQLLEQNKDVVGAMNIIRDQITQTNEAVQQISEASDVITSISSQTNLLALNASIEAARAGEAGKGFAVVATEIGELAEQTGTAAGRIVGIVDNLVRESEKSVSTMKDLDEDFKVQSKQIEDTRNDMDVLAQGVVNVSDRSTQINGQIGRLEDAKESLQGIMQDLSAISEENAASTEQTNASMEELNATFETISEAASELQTLSEALSREISFFKF